MGRGAGWGGPVQWGSRPLPLLFGLIGPVATSGLTLWYLSMGWWGPPAQRVSRCSGQVIVHLDLTAVSSVSGALCKNNENSSYFTDE